MRAFGTVEAIILEMALVCVVLAVIAAQLRRGGGSPQPKAREPRSETANHTDRAALVELCLDLGDRIDNPALLERLLRTLAEVGVTAVYGDGAVLDPVQHRVVDRVAATDPALHNRVASTERPGYLDRGRLLRPADVTVYHVG